MLKVGLIGLGSIGKTHKDTYDKIAEENGPIKVVAYFDMSEEAFSDTGDAHTYTDIDALLENEKGQLDYVDICVPTFMHKDISVKAMKMGYHVLCEKPMALSYKDAKEMCEVSKETGKKLMIAHVLRFTPFSKAVRECIESGELGKPRNARITAYRSGLPEGKNGWFGKESLSNGPIWDVDVHNIDLIKYFLGTPKAISSVGAKVNTQTVYDSISTNMIYDDGKYVNIHSDYAIKGEEY